MAFNLFGVLADHWGVGIILGLAALALLALIIAGLIVQSQAKRAQAEGRGFSAFWGLATVGEKAAPSVPPSLPSAALIPPPPSSGATVGSSGSFQSSAPADAFQRAVLAINRAAHQIAMAHPEGVEERENYLLMALFQATNQLTGVTRRASILKVHPAPGGDCVMRLHLGTPEALFRLPAADFSKKAYRDEQKGLCWHAVHTCQGAHEKDSIHPFVFYAPDVSKEPTFVSTTGHHEFRAILIAPILHERSSEVLGVVCLDSDVPDHYTAVDKHLVAIAALALSVAWKARKIAA